MSGAATQTPTLEDLRAKREEIFRIARAHRASRIRVFGSVARGDAGARDVDFVVDLPDDVRGFNAFGILDDLRRDLEAVVGCTVDVITIRGPFSARGAEIAQRIGREFMEL